MVKKILPDEILSCDLSDDEYLNEIASLGYEEERLDYKEKYDFSTKQAKQKSKVDLVCDIVSMANTFGGYILIGIKENEDKSFTIDRVDSDCSRKITNANIHNWLNSFVDVNLKINVKTFQINSFDLIAVCVAKYSEPPIVFNNHGQYSDENQKQIYKFRADEIFVRHGEKSERAKQADHNRFRKEIKNVLSKSLPQINLLEDTEEESQHKLEQLLINEIPFNLRKEFTKVIKNFQSLKIRKNYIELEEEPDEYFVKFLRNLFAVWVASCDYSKDNKLAEELTGSIYDLYSRINSYNPNYFAFDCLWYQSKIIFLAFLMGAFAVFQNKPEYSKLLLYKTNDFDKEFSRRNWFRYIHLMLARNNNLDNGGILGMSLKFTKLSQFILDQFISEEEIKSYLIQFDFLQCFQSILVDYKINKMYSYELCWPSFKVYRKELTEPIIEKIIETYDKGVWVEQIDYELCFDIINFVDQYVASQNQKLYGDWTLGFWNSKIIKEFFKS